MATVAAPYGLRPINRVDGMPYAGATDTFLIDPAGEATNIFYGQVLSLALTGISPYQPLLVLTLLVTTLAVLA